MPGVFVVVVLLHGLAGGWDEVAIAIAAFVVLWVAVKVAGRKPASDDEDEEHPSVPEAEAEAEAEQPSPTKLG